ncbi:hypothetical protein GPJ56_007212 [Histomonas meleagridis]|nr:hypothetical protein GPJ56_007212 [Histomonas meleagridis]
MIQPRMTQVADTRWRWRSRAGALRWRPVRVAPRMLVETRWCGTRHSVRGTQRRHPGSETQAGASRQWRPRQGDPGDQCGTQVVVGHVRWRTQAWTMAGDQARDEVVWHAVVRPRWTQGGDNPVCGTQVWRNQGGDQVGGDTRRGTQVVVVTRQGSNSGRDPGTCETRQVGDPGGGGGSGGGTAPRWWHPVWHPGRWQQSGRCSGTRQGGNP